MLKFRYLLIWVVVGFFSIAMFSFILENYMLKMEAMQVRSYTETAADCALQTGQGIDDFFAEPWLPSNLLDINNDGSRTIKDGTLQIGNWYNTPVLSGLRIVYAKNQSDDTYTESDLLLWFAHNIHSTSGSNSTFASDSSRDRYRAFEYLYDQSSGSVTAQEFYNFATSETCLRVYTQLPVVYNGVVEWVKVPRIALMGAKIFWGSEEEFLSFMEMKPDVQSIYGSTSEQRKKIWKALVDNKYFNIIRSSNAFGQYYLTPSKVGVSYIPRELVEKLYQNNLDLLLRARHNGDLSDYMGFVDDTWHYANDNVYVKQSNLAGTNNIINNGMITISKDTSTITNIEYRCVNIYDTSNNNLIRELYGGIHIVGASGAVYIPTGGIDVASAEKLKMRSTAVEMQLTGGEWTAIPHTSNKITSKYEIVAKVSFSTDVILSHKTAVFTNWGTTYDKSSDNVNDITVRNGIKTNKISRNNKYIYTRFYDVNA